MRFNKEYIFTISILAIILTYSYYYYVKNNYNKINLLWGNIKGNLLYFYYFSILFSVIAFILSFIYLLITSSLTEQQSTKLFISLSLMIIFSMFWFPLTLYYINNKKEIYKYLILLILLGVSLSILYFTIIFNNVKEKEYIIFKKIVLYLLIYFFLHCFFMDFLIWSYHFFK